MTLISALLSGKAQMIAGMSCCERNTAHPGCWCRKRRARLAVAWRRCLALLCSTLLTQSVAAAAAPPAASASASSSASCRAVTNARGEAQCPAHIRLHSAAASSRAAAPPSPFADLAAGATAFQNHFMFDLWQRVEDREQDAGL